MWPTPQPENMVNGSSALNESESDYMDITSEIPTSCDPTDFIISFVLYDDSQVVDTMFYKPFEKIILAVLFPSIFTFGFVGNVAFLTVVALVKEMRTLTNFYLANLAVADLLFLVSFLIHITGSYAVSNGVRYAVIERSDIQCAFVFGVVNASYFSSLCLITLVTFDRFLAICYPLKYRTNDTKELKVTLVIIAWIIGTAMGALITPTWASFFRFCLIWPPGERWKQLPNVYYRCLAVDQRFIDISTTIQPLAFIVTLAVNAIVYRKMIVRLHNRAIAKKQADKTKNTVARMLITNGIIFFFCLGPYQVANLLSFVGSKTANLMLDINQFGALWWISQSLLLLNSAINPYVYGIANPKYRKAFITAFTCQRSNHSKKTLVLSVSGHYAEDEMKL